MRYQRYCNQISTSPQAVFVREGFLYNLEESNHIGALIKFRA